MLSVIVSHDLCWILIEPKRRRREKYFITLIGLKVYLEMVKMIFRLFLMGRNEEKVKLKFLSCFQESTF